jgi:RNA polymerase sigma-70 factor (ECF subfamily)
MGPGAERDEYLMARVAAGQPELLELLVRRHASPLLTFLCRMTGDRHRAEELFQEAFLAVWVKRHQYQYPRPFKPWLYAIALNKCRAAFRRAGHATVSFAEEEAPVDEGGSPGELVAAAEAAELVGKAVTRLPPQQRAVVALRVWEGLPYDRIAEALGCTEVTVRSHMHHALASLRRLLQPLFDKSSTGITPGECD